MNLYSMIPDSLDLIEDHFEGCDCIPCHEIHESENYFQQGCEKCSEQFCLNCRGTGLTAKDTECLACDKGRLI